MTQHPHLKQRKLFTFTHQGCVTLDGTVESYFEKQMAQEAIRHIEGITQIDNQLEVAWDDLISEEWA